MTLQMPSKQFFLMNCSKKHGKFFDPTTSGKNICLQKNGVIIIFILNMKIRKHQQYGKRLSDNQAILKAGHYCLTTTYFHVLKSDMKNLCTQLLF